MPVLRPVPFRLSPLDIGRHLTCPQFLSRLQRIQRIQRIQRVQQLQVDAGITTCPFSPLFPSPCLTLFGLETAPSRGKNRQPPKILVTMKSDNLFIFCDNI